MFDVIDNIMIGKSGLTIRIVVPSMVRRVRWEVDSQGGQRQDGIGDHLMGIGTSRATTSSLTDILELSLLCRLSQRESRLQAVSAIGH